MKVSSRFRVLLLSIAMVPLGGCLFRSHKVERPSATANLQTATKGELVDRLNYIARNIHTMNATVDIATAVGGAKTGKVTEYQEIRGYILARQPGMLRMIGLLPVIRSRAFDMVSDGRQFELWIPAKNKFYVGSNSQVAPGATGLASMRPQIIYDALLLNDINGEDIVVLESGTETVVDPRTRKPTQQADYRIDVINRGQTGWYLKRKIYFSRIDLQPRMQQVFDESGNILTEVYYDKWQQRGAVWFPNVIQIKRPAEEYDITIGMVKLTMNEPLTDQQFALGQPSGSQLVRLDANPQSAVASPAAARRNQ
ncbi:MAG: hypothetical protein ACE14L_17625 [Terriglobales bacterium]